MRSLIGFTAASVVVAGAFVVGGLPAAYADDAGMHVFQQVDTGLGQGSRSAAPTHYLQIEARDAKAGVEANVDNDNVAFNHAKGTMAANPAQDAAGSDQNSRYTATYTSYMQMDPRDAKVASSDVKDVDGGNIYFNHAKGTMSGN